MTDQSALNEVVLATHGPSITVRSTTEPLDAVLATALKAYHETRLHDPGPPTDGPSAVGFANVERSPGPEYVSAHNVDMRAGGAR